MKGLEGKPDTVLWVEAFGFSLIIALSWLTELARIPHLVFGESFVPNWHRAALRTVVILSIWIWVHLCTKKLLKRLHYLEEFLRICSWCRKVGYRNQWLDMEEYFQSKFDTKTSHGMCPECMQKHIGQLKPDTSATPTADSTSASLPSPPIPGQRAAVRPDMFTDPQ